MIEIKGLYQSYGKKKILTDVHLTIEENEICALVGKNGAGKSTLIHSILGILPIKKGEIFLHQISHQEEQWKSHVSYLPEKFSLYPYLTGEENFTFFASLSHPVLNLERMEQCLKEVGLWEDRQRVVRHYSKGMLQRLGLSIMMYHDSSIWILDEPTSGLDPVGRKQFLGILKSLKQKTILFSSHHVDEIQHICTHVAVLEHQQMKKYTIEAFMDAFDQN